MDSALSRRAMLGLAAAAGLSVAACGRSEDNSGTSITTTVSSTDALAIATDAYVFGYPLILMHATKASGGPINTLQHAQVLPTADLRLLVRANVDTLYTMAWLDVSTEPMVLQMPPVEAGRYWMMQLLDAWSNTVQDPNSLRPSGGPHDDALSEQPTAGPPFTYLITGPNWSGETPQDVTHLPMPTNLVWLLGRIQVNGPDDLPGVRAVQEQMRLAPLTAWRADPNAPTPGVPLIGIPPGAAGPTKDVAAMDGRTYFDQLCKLMTVDTPAPADASAIDRFDDIGIQPGGSVDGIKMFDLAAAAAAGRKAISTYVDPATKSENGWRFSTRLGTYGTDYSLRARTALYGLGSNLPRNTLYPTITLVADDNGTPRRFRLRFEPGQLPPVDAFWSVTAYDADSFLVSNSANIYAVGHEIPVVPAPDGSVEILVQNADPGPGVPRGNWLPIPPAGEFSLTMRLYAPKAAAIEGKWRPPELKPVT
ncbi:DUF1254 domain-containing protein [Nocardia sp. NPDC051030]|uniref:DUF1254 domain-containing protein n=1 Tax=Nocardia sp. NPDC051030 TaxID=3155162 RepID=UPI003419004F